VAEGVTGRAAMEDLAAELRVLAESVAAAGADRAAVAAELVSLKSTLADLSIAAPIDGTILTKPPQVGELVSPTAAAFLELADFASLMVEAEVPESRLSKVRIGGPCEIMLDAHPSRRYRGVVREISPVVNRAKASVVVRVGFVGEAEGVLPNMAARAFILEGEESAEQIGQPPKIVVPSSALVERSGAQVVFIIDGDRVRMSPVQVGAPFGPGLELVEGPRVGTRLVKNPPATLSDGHRVQESKQ
jgi:HlyD family secretion protein